MMMTRLLPGILLALVVAGFSAPEIVAQQPTPPIRDAAGYAHAPRTADEFDQMINDISNWGRWGSDDQAGALNLITEAKRLEAAGLVKQGIVVSLAREIRTGTDPENTTGRPDAQHLMGQRPAPGADGILSDSYQVSGHSMTMTHLDTLCHILYKGKAYNGFTLEDIYAPDGCRVLGLAPYTNGIVTRGVLVDLPRLRGVPFLEPGTPVYVEDIEAWEEAVGVKITSGDVLFLRTGRWARRAQMGEWDVLQANAGFHPSVAPWLKERGVVIVGQDGIDGVQPLAFPGVPYPFHTMVMVGLGIDILDTVNLEDLAATAAQLKRWDFMLTVAPLRIPAGTGSPVNPLAIF
jgi:kynurenine formamidase